MSRPPKPNTWLKNSALTPSAAANDSTTVAISIERRHHRPQQQAQDEEHHAEDQRDEQVAVMGRGASATSRLIAVPPPTMACAPGMACTAVRTLSDQRVGGLAVRRRRSWSPCRKDLAVLVTGWVTEAMPCVPASAVLTCRALDAVQITSMGSPEPAGKCLASTFCAAMDGGVPRNDWAVGQRAELSPIMPAAPAASRIAVTIHTVRGRRRDGPADPGPEPAAGRLGRAETRPDRPEDPPAEDHRAARAAA